MSHQVTLPAEGYVRLSQIVGNPKAKPPIPAVFPVCKAGWWNGVRSGKYPKPVKLGPRITAWKVSDIRALLERAAKEGKGQENADT
jgi:prophage regulatory protein